MKIRLLKSEDIKSVNDLAKSVISNIKEDFKLSRCSEYIKEDMLNGFFIGAKNEEGELIASLYVKISFDDNEGISNYLNLVEDHPEIHCPFISKDCNEDECEEIRLKIRKKARRILKEHGFKWVYNYVHPNNFVVINNILSTNTETNNKSSIIKLTEEKMYLIKTSLTKKTIPTKTKSYQIIAQSTELNKINKFLNEGYGIYKVNKYRNNTTFEVILH